MEVSGDWYPEPPFVPEESVMMFTTVFKMTLQEGPDNHAQQLYEKYKKTVKDYISTMVLPSLREKQGEFMLQELVKRWKNHKVMVYEELKGKAKDAVIDLIGQEREGEVIDKQLPKKVLGIFVQVGMGEMNHYVNDFENDMLAATAAYYSKKASYWILENSYLDYMLKVEDCLRKEKERVSHYLHLSNEPKLLEYDYV